ncbi:AsmA-like C-terminal region-containing protein [Aureimonas leprariae]|uniref:DUF3971 domain-containing protein n=1 Tax=Plantimonas leprariae TaxID=2615207 RepID=A0A7V7PS16_9HYPH|nr:AsmA-like C-terminal region-containing protein [Aureimonas leprariae]KAB0681815.1 hypothetical protein F6X38_03040 [Aureimonas leprariae]
MHRFLHGLIGLASTGVTGLAVVCAATVVLVDSEGGRNFLRQQTEAVVGRVLGPDYSADLGRQSVTLKDGRLGIRWDAVEIRRAGVAEPQAKAQSIALGFDVMPLFAGRLLVRSLAVSGVEIDLTGAPEAAEVAATAKGLAPSDPAPATLPPEVAKALLPALAERLLGQTERQLGALDRIGIDAVAISNLRLIAPVAPGGGPFVSYVEQLDLDLGDPRDMRLDGTVRVDRLRMPIHARLDFDPNAKRLIAGRSTVGPIELERLLPPGIRGDPNDVRPFGSDSAATLTLDVASPFGSERRSARLGLALDAGHLHQGRGHIDLESADLSLDYVEGDDRVTLGPNRFRGSGFEASFAGGLTPIYDRPDGGFNGFGLEVASTKLRSTVGSQSQSPTDGTFSLKARTDIAARQAKVTELDLRAGDGSLTGTASFGYGSPDAKVQLSLDLRDLSAAAVKALWPFDIAVAPRKWVHENVGDAGRLTAGTIALNVTRQRMDEASRPGNGYEPGELEMNFALEGLDVRSFSELPSLRNAQGNVETHGGDTLVAVATADVDGLPDAAVEGGLVTFSRVPDAAPPRTDLKITGNIRSGLKDLAAIADRPPLRSVVSLPFEAKDAVGSVKTVADVDMALGNDLPDGRALKNWKVALDLADAGSRVPLGGHKIGDVTGTVTIEPGAVTGDVHGDVDGAGGALTFRRALGAEPPEGRRMEAKLHVDASDAVKLAPILNDVVTGPIEADIVQDADARYRADVNLSGSSLNLPWLGWRKGKGVGAKLAFTVRSDEGRTAVDDLVLKGEGFAATGYAEADKAGLKTAELHDVSLNPGDDVNMKLARVDNGFSIAISGDRFDARPLLADIRNDIGAKTAAQKREGQQFDVSASFDKVIGFGNEAIANFSLDYAGSGSRVAALSITGKGRKGAPFSIDVSPRGKARSIEIAAQDAGSLLDFTGAYAHMEGGKLSLSLLGTSDDGYQGKLEAKNFTLVDEPRLSSLVASPPSPDSKSLSQAVGKDLQTKRATFDHASAGISFGKDGLRLTDGIIRGPIFGSSFAGTVYDPKNRIDISGSFMPAYGLNRVFGAIPVVGQILGNGREGGLIGITYKLSGNYASPKLEINPISAIAPGIFRNIFAYR